MPGSGTAGGTNEPGLPELEGSFTPAIQNSATGTYNLMPAIDHRGAFRSNGEDLTGYFAPEGTGMPMERGVTFAASRCSDLYGGAATVMPQSIDVPLAIYLGLTN